MCSKKRKVIRALFCVKVISGPVYFYFLDTSGVLGRHSGAKDIVQYTTYVHRTVLTQNFKAVNRWQSTQREKS